jgi:predicted nucleic acid-binding Zn ribbon protein
MAQVSPRYCPRCGAPIVTDSRFCTTCGLPVEAMLSRETQRQPAQDHQYDQEQVLRAEQQASQYNPHVQQSYQQTSVEAAETAETAETTETTETTEIGERSDPQYVPQPFQEQDKPLPAPKLASKKINMGRRGLMPLLVALIVLLGAAGYITAGLLGVHLPGFRGKQPPVTTMVINSSVPYAGVDITVVSAQQSQSFVDAPDSGSNGMVRLNLRTQNKTGIKVSWSYTDLARLVLPDNSIVNPTYIKNAAVEIAPGTSQASAIDFAVPSSDHINQLLLQLGATNEAQMLIPLTGSADMSIYRPKTVSLNGQMQYFGLNWTLSSATSSLSIEGKQALSGMRYVTVTLKVDNTLSQLAITGSPYDYVRLKFGNTTVSPKNSTLPVAFNAGVSRQSGTVSFLVPQNTRSFTLILLPQQLSGTSQASVDFQLAS